MSQKQLNLAKLQLKILTDEINRRKQSKLDFIDHNFEAQARFITDRSPFVAGFCTRRAGKSYGGGLRLVREAQEVSGVSVLYLALTRDSARKIMWKDVLKTIDKKFGLGIKFNETLLEATLPNGSVIYLTGADAKPDEMEKLLGQKYKFVLIDEGASFRQDLRRIVYFTLKPAVSDYEGTIAMIGTPSNRAAGFFYDVTTGKEPGWSLHRWTAHDNPYMKVKWESEINELKRLNPNIVETPGFKQMYLGEWSVDANQLCYKFSRERNSAPELPREKTKWNYILGVDLGFDPDPSAFVVGCYKEYDKNLYFIETHKQKQMIFSDVAERIKYYQKKYPELTIVIDAANKQGVEEMKRRHGIPLKYAEKTDKATFIDLMSSDLICGNIKLLDGTCEDLVTEWSKLIWDENSDRREEDSQCQNHLSDAALYMWRYAYNYAAGIRPTVPNLHSEDKVDEFWEKEAKKIERQKKTNEFDEEFYD